MKMKVKVNRDPKSQNKQTILNYCMDWKMNRVKKPRKKYVSQNLKKVEDFCLAFTSLIKNLGYQD